MYAWNQEAAQRQTILEMTPEMLAMIHSVLGVSLVDELLCILDAASFQQQQCWLHAVHCYQADYHCLSMSVSGSHRNDNGT